MAGRVLPFWVALLTLLTSIDANIHHAAVKWVLIEVTEDRTEIVKTETQQKHTNLEHTYSHLKHEENRQGQFNIYYHHKGRTVHAQSVGDPRIMRADALERHGHLAGELQRSDSGYISLTLPVDAEHVTVSRTYGETKQHTLQVPRGKAFMHHKFATQASSGVAGKIETIAIQKVGSPDTHKNLVFMSGGYTVSQRSKFMSDVTKCFDFLRGEGGGTLMSSPWDRYMPIINVWAVFQPSVEAGASYPKQPDFGEGTGGGAPTTGLEVIKANNLNCKYGTSHLRYLSCDYKMVQALGSNAPPNPGKTTLIVLVNDVVYGGTGGNRVAVVYTGTKMLQLLMHELAHADADLSDEYNYGFAETKALSLKNCAYSSVNPPWEQWIGKNAPTGLEIGTPVKGCGYTNYYRPTEDHCLMGTETSSELCAACTSWQIRAIYQEQYDLASPRCPRENEFIVITTTSSANLVANRQFFKRPVPKFAVNGPTWPKYPDGTPYRYDKGEIDVMWHTDTGKAPSFEYNYTVTGMELGPGDHKVYLTINDRSFFINSPHEGILERMTMETVFDVRVVDPTSNPDWEFCNNQYLDSIRDLKQAPEVAPNLNHCPSWVSHDARQFYYCSSCKAGHICNDTYLAKPFEARTDVNGIINKVEDVIFGVGVALVLVGVVAFIALAWFLRKRSNLRPKEVIPYPRAIINVRYTMIASSVIGMLASVSIILLGTWVYENRTAYGKALIVCAIIFACFMFLVQYLGFLAAYWQHKALLLINGLMLTVVVLVNLGLSVSFYYVGTNIESASTRDSLQEHWIRVAEVYPEDLCAFQSEYSCSGFLSGCHNKMHSECPKNCEATNNNNPVPCYHIFRWIQYNHYMPVGICSVGLAVIMCFATLLNWVMFIFIRKRNYKRDMRLRAPVIGEEDDRLSGVLAFTVLKNLTRAERRGLYQEFLKVDYDGSGCLEPLELKDFYKQALGQELSVKEVQQILIILDKNGDGVIDFHELMSCGQSDAERKQMEIMVSDPRLQHINPDVVHQLYEDFIRMDDDNNQILTLRDIKRYYKRLYKVEANDSDLRAALRALDHDGNCEDINFVEFAQMFAAAQQRAQELEMHHSGMGIGSPTATGMGMGSPRAGMSMTQRSGHMNTMGQSMATSMRATGNHFMKVQPA
mmetsp:Transcript_79925/g.141116  ORF Transcript_79925/g.141116 Transcript_79925/m.141116 type:complete len:1152 (-) Transcript_79925:2138-5593(-)